MDINLLTIHERNSREQILSSLWKQQPFPAYTVEFSMSHEDKLFFRKVYFSAEIKHIEKKLTNVNNWLE